MPVRRREARLVKRLQKHLPLVVKSPEADPHTKTNVLLQARRTALRSQPRPLPPLPRIPSATWYADSHPLIGTSTSTGRE